MNRCLFCKKKMIEKVSWRKLFLLETHSRICEKCERELRTIRGERCLTCSRSLDLLPKNKKKDGRCIDCWRWEERPATRHLFERNRSLFHYNDFLKELFKLYKFRGDAEIAIYFAEKLAHVYAEEFDGYIPVEIPLSMERLYARGFNQSALLMQGWAEETGILLRQVGEKQSKRNRRERINQVMTRSFHVNEEKRQMIFGKKIVLIDDIYTTGTTVRQAARVLLESGAVTVSSLTVAR